MFLLEGERRCLACALQYRPLLRRSALTALVVGTALVAINQGNSILGGGLPLALLWKIPLTYAVPFCVATWSALMNSREPLRRRAEAKADLPFGFGGGSPKMGRRRQSARGIDEVEEP